MNLRDRFERHDTFATGFAFLCLFVMFALYHVVTLRLGFGASLHRVHLPHHRERVLHHSRSACPAVMQSTALFAECTALVCMMYRPTRPVYGMVFLGFHIVSWMVFGEHFDFLGNIGIALMMLASPFMFRKIGEK